MKKLKPITEKEILETAEIIWDEDVGTQLVLNDSDWMNYTLEARFNTKEQQQLHVQFEYFGLKTSKMSVVQLPLAEYFSRYTQSIGYTGYIYTFDTQIFKEELMQYMQHHIDSWYSTRAFDGKPDALHFYNRVIEETKGDDITVVTLDYPMHPADIEKRLAN